jgi:hypothetical protein
VKLRRKRCVMDPDQREHPLVQQRDALLKREAALGDELAAWARHAHYRLGGQYVTGSLRAYRTSAKAEPGNVGAASAWKRGWFVRA